MSFPLQRCSTIEAVRPLLSLCTSVTAGEASGGDRQQLGCGYPAVGPPVATQLLFTVPSVTEAGWLRSQPIMQGWLLGACDVTGHHVAPSHGNDQQVCWQRQPIQSATGVRHTWQPPPHVSGKPLRLIAVSVDEQRQDMLISPWKTIPVGFGGTTPTFGSGTGTRQT